MQVKKEIDGKEKRRRGEGKDIGGKKGHWHPVRNTITQGQVSCEVVVSHGEKVQ